MKALVVTPYYYPYIGGLENYARQLNRALKQTEKWDIVVVTSAAAAEQVASSKIDGNHIYRLNPWFKLSNTPINPLWPLKLRRIIKHEQPDVILAHTPVPSMADAVSLVVGKRPFIVINHAATLYKQGSPLFNLATHIYNFFSSYTFHRADRILVVSEYVRTQLSPRLQSKATVTPNAIWPKEIEQRNQPLGSNFIFIGSLDRSHAWKGLETIIESISIYNKEHDVPTHLTVVGDGNHKANYENQVAQLGITESVTFTGAKRGVAKDRLIKQASALIAYPTTRNDAFPTVILEAWAKHVPVIAANIGSLSTIVDDKINGFLVEPSNAKALADSLYYVAEMPEKQRAEVAGRAALQTKQSYTWNQSASIVRQATEALV
jgi:glycosyltransferase involved in cell wall biosynthesis